MILFAVPDLAWFAYVYCYKDRHAITKPYVPTATGAKSILTLAISDLTRCGQVWRYDLVHD